MRKHKDVSRATYSWWAATETASGSMATQGLEDLRTVYCALKNAGKRGIKIKKHGQKEYKFLKFECFGTKKEAHHHSLEAPKGSICTCACGRNMKVIGISKNDYKNEYKNEK